MNRPQMALWLGTALSVAFSAFGCTPGGVGDPCTPEDEYQPGFQGYGVGEVNIESRSFQCETRLCLVNHFQGRVSCPYGQKQAIVDTAAPESGARCHLPDGTGNVVTVPVDPQLIDRRADDAVYCSCRCNGPDKNARYCTCPSGYSCTKLTPDLGLGGDQLAGSYCVRSGTQYDPIQTHLGDVCNAQLANCPSDNTSSASDNPP